MPYNIHTEVASGAVSRGYDREDEESASKCFERVKRQLVAMKFVGSIVVDEGGIELQREYINAA